MRQLLIFVLILTLIGIFYQFVFWELYGYLVSRPVAVPVDVFQYPELESVGENSKNIKKGSSNSDHVPLFKKLETEPLEQTLGEIFGNDGGVNFMSNDLNIPTFMRKQMDT